MNKDTMNNIVLTCKNGELVDVSKVLTSTTEKTPKSLLFLGYRGSQAHGTFVPSTDPDSVDDVDLMGLYFAQPEHYLGFGRRDNVAAFINEYDMVFYEVRKFMHLLMKQNPNVLSMLWLSEKDILYKTDALDYLVKRRDLFKSKEAFNSYSGYAYAQLKKMTHLNQGLLAEIGRREDTLYSFCRFENGEFILPAGARDSDIELLRQYNEMKSKYFAGYMGHKRKGLVEKYGYDCKNASHLIRLLRMCVEYLETGEMIVNRPDAQELIEIKTGQWPLEKVQVEAAHLFEEAEKARDNSNLPDKVDRNAIEQVCVEMIKRHFVAEGVMGLRMST